MGKLPRNPPHPPIFTGACTQESNRSRDEMGKIFQDIKGRAEGLSKEKNGRGMGEIEKRETFFK